MQSDPRTVRISDPQRVILTGSVELRFQLRLETFGAGDHLVITDVQAVSFWRVVDLVGNPEPSNQEK